jgi:hypothetical protein
LKICVFPLLDSYVSQLVVLVFDRLCIWRQQVQDLQGTDTVIGGLENCEITFVQASAYGFHVGLLVVIIRKF